MTQRNIYPYEQTVIIFSLRLRFANIKERLRVVIEHLKVHEVKLMQSPQNGAWNLREKLLPLLLCLAGGIRIPDLQAHILVHSTPERVP